jgi:hypothetical protein
MVHDAFVAALRHVHPDELRMHLHWALQREATTPQVPMVFSQALLIGSGGWFTWFAATDTWNYSLAAGAVSSCIALCVLLRAKHRRRQAAATGAYAEMASVFVAGLHDSSCSIQTGLTRIRMFRDHRLIVAIDLQEAQRAYDACHS